MSERQIAEVAGTLVRHQHHFGVMSTEDRQWVIQNTETAIGLFAEAVKNRGNGKATEPKKLLKFVTTVPVGASEGFKATDHFKVDTKNAEVRIAWLGDNFKEHFGRKVEGATEAAEIRVHALTKPSLDAPIIAELGEKAEITLGQFFAAIAKQGTGEEGPLFVNDYANIAYIRDVKGILWVVGAYWNAVDGGWFVGANEIENPPGWDGGLRVLSR